MGFKYRLNNNYHLILLLGKDGWYWTSGSDLGEEGSFFWASNGRSISKNSSLWLPNQPDNAGGSENCVHLWDTLNYKINDLPCNTQCYFICEITLCSD